MTRLEPLRAGLLAVAIFMGLVIAWRMIFGPFRIFFPVNAPLNPEGLFGLAITVLLLTAARTQSLQPAAVPARRTVMALVLAVVLITWVGLSRALRIYFLSDDFPLMRAVAGWTPRHFFRAFFVPIEYLFFRPVGYLFVGLNVAWSSNPVWWHASLLALHVCNAVLVLFVARRMGASAVAAGFAAALFGIHGTRPEAAVWIGSSFDPIATLFVLAGFLLFARARKSSGSVRSIWLTGSLACSVLAMLSKEAAFIFPFLVLIYAISKKDSVRSAIPFFVTAALAFVYRWSLLGRIGGYTAEGAGQPMVFSLGLQTTLKAVLLRLWAFLYFPINWSADPALPLSMLALIYIACMVWLAARSTPAVSLWPALAAMLVSILPPLAILSGSATLAGSRVLYLPSVWFCVLLALAIDGLRSRWRYVVAAAVVAFNLAALQHNLDSWEYASAKSKAACDLAAAASLTSSKLVVIGKLPGEIRGVEALKNGFQECVEFSARRPVGMEFLKDWPAVRDDAAYLFWDDDTDQLRSR